MAVVGLLVGCLLFLGLLGAGGVGAWWWWTTKGGPPVVAGGPDEPSASPSTPTSSTTTPSAAAGDLAELAGTWSIDSQDPNYDPNDSSGQGIPFAMEGGRLVARSPEGDQGELRILSRQGDDLRGEYEEGSTRQPVTGRVDGDRMTLTVEGESITFRRDGGGATVIGPRTEGTPEVGWQPEDPPAPDFLPVFEDVGDVDGDGSQERVMVVAEDETGLADPTRAAPRRLVVVKSDGTVAFQTDVFQEPFRPDLNELADGPQNYAGVHVTRGGGPYADIRLVFAPASGNFVVFRYDGSTYQIVESGD